MLGARGVALGANGGELVPGFNGAATAPGALLGEPVAGLPACAGVAGAVGVVGGLVGCPGAGVGAAAGGGGAGVSGASRTSAIFNRASGGIRFKAFATVILIMTTNRCNVSIGISPIGFCLRKI
jgi:hypothetical protein